MKERCSNQRATGWPLLVKGIGAGCLSGLLFCAALTGIFSLVLLKYDAADPVVFGLAMVAAGLSAFAAGFIAARFLRKNGLLMGLVCAVVLFALFTAFGMCTGSVLTPRVAVKLCVMCACGVFGGIIGVNLRKKLK